MTRIQKEGASMIKLSKKILEGYQVRKTQKQKLAFIELLQSHFPELQVRESSIAKCRNIVIGDVETADVILSAHYDTCSVLPIPNFITPTKPVFTILYSILLILPLLVVTFLINALLNQISNAYWLNYFISLIIYFGLLSLFILGPANKHTANDNTSGVITLVELLKVMDENTRKKVAVVFFDHEETGLWGSRQFRKQYNSVISEKLLINFDCVSDGDYILMAATKEARERYGEELEKAFRGNNKKQFLIENMEKVYYPSDHAGFPVAIAVAALKKKPVWGYYMDRIHTHKDVIFDQDNIRLLRDSVIHFLEIYHGTDSTEAL